MGEATWIHGLTPERPGLEAARLALRDRLQQVDRAVERLRGKRRAKSGRAGEADLLSARSVHRARVAARRGVAAIDAFADVLPPEESVKVRKRLVRLRRAAGAVRDLDAFQAALSGPPAEGGKPLFSAGVRAYLSPRLEAVRAAAARDLAGVIEGLAGRPGGEGRNAGKRSPSGVGQEGKLARGHRKLLNALDEHGGRERSAAPTVAELRERMFARRAEAVRRAAAADLRDHAAFHALRVQLKKLRYELEIGVSGDLWSAPKKALRALIDTQRRLGAVTDARALPTLLGRVIGAEPPRSTRRRAQLDEAMDAAHRRADGLHWAFLEGWSREALEALLDGCARAYGLEGTSPTTARAQEPPAAAVAAGAGTWDEARMVELKPGRAGTAGMRNGVHRAVGVHANGSARRAGSAGPNSDAGHGPAAHDSARLAAIDVGTNSVRLIVAEAFADLSYRVLDDEKEMTRLGRGLHATGRMDPDAIEHTAAAVERMASIARGYGAARPRVIGTAAAREASNTDALSAALRARAGVELELISGEQEALLAYASAARAFDLRSTPAAVVDIGGGSTEVVLSVATRRGGGRARAREAAGGGGLGLAGAMGDGGGAIDRVFSIPLGAVKLTEKFGGAEAAGGKRFAEMKRLVRRVVKEHLGRLAFTPGVLIGTGGTFTTLAAMAMQHELGTAADGLFAGAVQGASLSAPDVRHWLEFLRKLPARQRARVPGLPDERADIIVAGVLLVDVLIRRLGVNEARVHDGGIRDGLMLSMVREHFGRASGGTGGAAGLDKGGNARAAGGPTQDVMTARAGSPLRGVRRFAESCNYEASHAGHVAGLALQIFDAVGPWAGGRRVHRAQEGESPRLPAFTARDRTLLEAAALLHDVGYLVNYASHHKHSYHLIVHADLPGFTHREIQVIANVARYHRAAAPKPRHRAFAVLSADDRTLVRALSALLRIADGLDRTHMQRVTGVLVTLGRKQARFVVSAGEEPSVDLWGAIRKSDLFGAVFGRAPEFEWAAGRSAAPPNVRVSGGVEAALMPRNGD